MTRHVVGHTGAPSLRKHSLIKLSPLPLALSLAVFGLAQPAQAAPSKAQALVGTAQQLSGSYWRDIAAPESRGTDSNLAQPGLAQWRALELDGNSMLAAAAGAPMENTDAARLSPAVISLPHPDGSFQRFSLVESPVMAPSLAERHPEIKTYAGRGIDDPTATLRMDITPLGLHASVRSGNGAWYVEPRVRRDTSVYAAFKRSALPADGGLREPAMVEPQLVMSQGRVRAGEAIQAHGAGFAAGASLTATLRDAQAGVIATQQVRADAEGVVTLRFDGHYPPGNYELNLTADATRSARSQLKEAKGVDGDLAEPATASAPLRVLDLQEPAAASTGTQLRTYRLALLTDPGYATFHGGSANVLPAKVSLINRVTQVYEDETSIRLMLIDDHDALDLDTAAKMTGVNGPCGGAACYTTAQAAGCDSPTLTQNRLVIGLLAGARNFDIGHIAMGKNGGGIAALGVVGSSNKAQGCTGVTTPVGDLFAVDYVAHEMGHQFGGDHTFNGTQSNCSTGNRTGASSVEPGSGSSVMAYAGICSTDNLQAHSDPYWSMRSFDQITTYTSGAESNLNEVQMGVLTGFSTNGQQFTLSFGGQTSAAIVRGTNFTTAGVKAAIQGISGWPAGATVTVSALSDNAFTVTFGGTLAGKLTDMLALNDCSGGCTGKMGEIVAGGASAKQGAISPLPNNAPVVTVPAGFTIPVRTPFALTGSATDAEGDVITYLWEQTDRGASGTNGGIGLVSNAKVNGPLFRQFGTRALVSATDTLEFESPNENMTSTSSTRVFPDMAQILANNTNVATGSCPTADATPTGTQIDCFSEFLPTAAYVGVANVNNSPASLHMRLTARDGRGGVGSATTTLTLAAAAGPFLVSAPNGGETLVSELPQTVTWAVAGTNAAPVSTANVRITLSADGGASFPYVLAASTPNSGSASVALPSVATSQARLRIEAVNNVFFDVSDANFSIRLYADVNVDGAVDCTDMSLVKAALGKRTGQAGYGAMLDVNGDGAIDVRDLAIVSRHLASGTVCN